LGGRVLLRRAGRWIGDRFAWPAVLVAAGSAVMWTRTDGSGRGAAWIARSLPESWRGAATVALPRLRILAGALLVVAGVGGFLTANDPRFLSLNAPLVGVATLVAIVVIAGPLFWRLARQLTEERRQRIR